MVNQASVAGFILRAQSREETAVFYRALGLSAAEHAHGGPVHFELGPTDPACVAEIYKWSPNFPADALMVKVSSIKDALHSINETAEIREVGDMRLAYVTDPDGRAVMVYEVVQAEVCDATGLAGQKCLPCGGGIPPLSKEEVMEHLATLDGWEHVTFDGCLKKTFYFQKFSTAMGFIVAFGKISEREQHHPDFCLSDYREVRVSLITKAIDALSINDFILAAKIDALVK